MRLNGGRNIISVFSLILLLTFGCSKKEPPTLWEKAATFVKHHSSENYLNNIDPTFKMLDEEHTAAVWVNYFFSVLSTRNWVGEDDEYAEYSREPLVPKGITITPNKRKDDVNLPQLVVKADKGKAMIIVEGYDFPNDKGIVFKDQWAFSKLD